MITRRFTASCTALVTALALAPAAASASTGSVAPGSVAPGDWSFDPCGNWVTGYA